jgi:hypothetical protein
MNRDDAKALLQAVLIAAILIVAAAALACAEDTQPKPPARFTCWAVRQAVKLYGEAEVIAWAKAKGASDEEIDRGRRCIKRS